MEKREDEMVIGRVERGCTVDAAVCGCLEVYERIGLFVVVVWLGQRAAEW